MKKIVTLLSLASALLHTPVLNLYAQPFIFTPGNELNYHHSEGSEMNISAEEYSGRQNNSDSSILYFGNWKLTPEAPGFYCNDFKSSNT